MNTNTEYCTPCELPFAAQNQTNVEAESCPVCFTEEGLRKLNGCGHSICGDCETNLKRTPGQFTETLGLSVKYIKCPLCRQTEKKTYEQLEAELIYYRDRRPRELVEVPVLRPQQVFNINEPTIVESQVAVIRALRERMRHLDGLNRLTDIPEREAIVTELSYIQRNWSYAVRAYDIQHQREQLRLAEEEVNELIARRDLLIAREPNPELRAVLQTEAARADTSGASEITEETRTAARALVARGGISTVDLDGTPRTQNEMYAVALRSVLEQRQRQQAAAVERDNARRFALAGVAVGAGRTNRQRLRCVNFGCETPAPTQRRCPNHINVPCCRRCNTCDDCP